MFLSKKERSKSLRRFTKAKISTPVVQPANSNLELPKKIIKALYDYDAKSPHEISFKKGDFFHVVARENDPQWFEACNPAFNLKGLVPVNYFQVIDKTERSLNVSRPISSSTTNSSLTSELDSGFSDLSIHGNKNKKQIYGVVMYNFKAERPDELEAQAGEAIVVIAQTNHEWYIAKPISRLGGPGLIPVSFVQVRDVATGELIDDRDEKPSLPGVEDWKKISQVYDEPSIPLGHFEDESARHSGSSSSESMNYDIVTFASIDSYILEGDQYWFVVYARVNDHCHRILYRLYEDFYDFQMNFMQAFPVEAGQSDQERIIPFMPGPLSSVDEKITNDRKEDLNQYCTEILSLPRYLSESELVQRQLFGIHEGDIELDYDPRVTQVEQEEREDQLLEQLEIQQPQEQYKNDVHNTSTDQLSEQSQPQQQQQQQQQQLKIKIIHKDDIFAMKVPTDCSLSYLKKRVYERIQSDDIKMEYKNEVTGKNEPLEEEIDMETAFIQATQRGKLTLTTVPNTID
ncbi:Protein scd2/ral3 [Choanephora cucurbitarum]|uniref:Protein scd2/ral3 n=1 Tax=Choanephora cucurbitarum TaxID=101091 RepID=A0A1C7NQ18_9FUNG|nr:Protein scd2/ral3 [Choanephora cucurbitarum]